MKKRFWPLQITLIPVAYLKEMRNRFGAAATAGISIRGPMRLKNVLPVYGLLDFSSYLPRPGSSYLRRLQTPP
jgi:hypothetical protein